MKNPIICLCLLISVGMLQACNQNTKDTATAADSSSEVQDTAKLNLITDKDDEQFAVTAALSNEQEIALGKLALLRGKSKKVKNLGAMMIKDHGKANIRLLPLLKEKKIALPLNDTTGQKVETILAARSGSDFDSAYISVMLKDHDEAVALFKDASVKCQDPDLKDFARKTLPVLQKHLDAVTAIQESMR